VTHGPGDPNGMDAFLGEVLLEFYFDVHVLSNEVNGQG
jgi:hypothetical protein